MKVEVYLRSGQVMKLDVGEFKLSYNTDTCKVTKWSADDMKGVKLLWIDPSEIVAVVAR